MKIFSSCEPRFHKREYRQRNSKGQLEAVIEITSLMSDGSFKHPIKIVCDEASIPWRSHSLEPAMLFLEDGSDTFLDDDGNICEPYRPWEHDLGEDDDDEEDEIEH